MEKANVYSSKATPDWKILSLDGGDYRSLFPIYDCWPTIGAYEYSDSTDASPHHPRPSRLPKLIVQSTMM